MKTRLIIIIGIVVALAIPITSISLTYNQEIKLIMGMKTDDTLSVDKLELSDPICFVTDRSSSDNIGSGVTLDTCITLEKFEEMGCTKPMLEHLLRYSNLLDEELHGSWYLDHIGLPDGMSIEDFDKCVDAIIEKRPILNLKSPDALESIKDHPLVDEFYAKYPNTREEIRSDHISYFVGSDDGYLVRMNLYFDDNYVLENIDFHCYYQKVHQLEIPQEDLVSKIEKYDCKEYTKSKK